jgi:hypothetical protein
MLTEGVFQAMFLLRLRITTVALLTLLMSGYLPLAVGQEKEVAPARPKVTGDWTGTWAPYAPPALAEDGKTPTTPKYTKQEMRLDCKVVELKDGSWQATFEGECGRPYKYVVHMHGRQAGGSVLFQGSADLGEKDGGVYDWIGRAIEGEFVGFFTSQKYTGYFRLSRSKPAPPRRDLKALPGNLKPGDSAPARPVGGRVPGQGVLVPKTVAPKKSHPASLVMG